MQSFVHLFLIFWLNTVWQYQSSMSSIFLVFNTSGVISRPAAFQFLISDSIMSSSTCVNCPSLMYCGLLTIFVIGSSVNLRDFPSRFLKGSYHKCILCVCVCVCVCALISLSFSSFLPIMNNLQYICPSLSVLTFFILSFFSNSTICSSIFLNKHKRWRQRILISILQLFATNLTQWVDKLKDKNILCDYIEVYSARYYQ